MLLSERPQHGWISLRPKINIVRSKQAQRVQRSKRSERQHPSCLVLPFLWSLEHLWETSGSVVKVCKKAGWHGDNLSKNDAFRKLGPELLALYLIWKESLVEGSDGSGEVKVVNKVWMAAHSSLFSPTIHPLLPLCFLLVRLNVFLCVQENSQGFWCFLFIVGYFATCSSSLNIDVCETICGLGAACLRDTVRAAWTWALA